VPRETSGAAKAQAVFAVLPYVFGFVIPSEARNLHFSWAEGKEQIPRFARNDKKEHGPKKE